MTKQFDGFEGAICAYVATKREGFVEPAFDNAVIDIKTTEAIDEYAAANAIALVAKRCRRFYALIKHGSTRKRLSKQEREESKPVIQRGENWIRFDFRQLLGRLWNIASAWTPTPEQANLFEPLMELIKERTTTLGEDATRDLLKHLVNKVAVVIASIGVVSAVGLCAVEWHKDDNQTEIALNRMYLEDGQSNLTEDREVAAAEIESKISHAANILTEISKDDPVLTFASVQVEQFRPALFEIIASSGGGIINAVEFTDDGAKQVKGRATENARKGVGMWTTTVSYSS
ncbi:MAG: hypothetical protein K0U74_13960 [Alphaproteobacteria bacterium]|nr:hypothetical protein [Alphaproteobacteria bacterium]